MSDEPSSRYCSNCQREISTDNYQMHVLHCQRNIQLCPKCQEPVPRSQMESHDLENHAIVKCDDCPKTMEQSLLDEHKKHNCPKRQQTCEYCELELKADSMLEHVEYCGARTEPCGTCGKLIMMKYQRVHEDSGHRKTKPDESPSNSDDEEDDSPPARHVYPERTGSADRTNNVYRRRPDILDFDSDLDETFENLELDHVRNTGTVRPYAAYGPIVRQGDRPVNNANWEESTLIPCEFCELPIVADQLVLHETGCRPDLSSAPGSSNERGNWNYDSSPEDERQKRKDVNKQDAGILIPCEFCQKLFALDFLNQHQSACQNLDAVRFHTSRLYHVDDN